MVTKIAHQRLFHSQCTPIIFCVGPSGSGKTTYLNELVGHQKSNEPFKKLPHNFVKYDDFSLHLFPEFIAGHFAKKLPEGGYTITDSRILDDALEKLNDRGMEFLNIRPPNTSLIFEFSRKNYRNAFGFFDSQILLSARILYFDVSPEMSKHRNIIRHDGREMQDEVHHKVPKEDLIKYYLLDDWSKITHERNSGLLNVCSINLPFVNINNEKFLSSAGIRQKLLKSLDLLFSINPLQ